jgi:predicted Zn-dependent peptidase
MMIGVGTRDEPPYKQGLAHFLEHMLFKGTGKRTSYQVISRLEAVGGELNAFTTKEETCVHASFLTPHFDRTMELLSDILLNSIFPEKELNLEKQVVMDEIRSYADNPMEQIFDDFECQVFEGQALGTPVLGTRESVSEFKRTDLARFISRCFTADRMVFSYAGSLPASQVMTAVDKYFPAGRKSGAKSAFVRSGRTRMKQVVQLKPIQQAHYMTGACAFSCHSSKRFPLFLMNNILGGPGMNSRLNVNLRERNGLTYHIESSYVPFSDTGLFQVYLATDYSKIERATGLVRREFMKLRDIAISGSQLTRHKYQLKSQLALAQENISGIMLANAKSVLNYDKPVRLNEIFRKIENITASDLLDVANEILDEGRLSSLLFQPEV